MNYFAHALPFLDRPYFAAATGVPDWLSVVDRPVRVRSKHVVPFLEDPDVRLAAVAGGILQHIRDDARFHRSRAFVELSLELTVKARDALADASGFRCAFLGHLLVELLLDASLTAQHPEQLDAYYRMLESIDPACIQRAVNRMAPRRTGRLADMISAFCRHRVLSDYREDDKLLVRLSQVMRRVRLEPLPESFLQLLPEARLLVDTRREELLDGIPTGTM